MTTPSGEDPHLPQRLRAQTFIREGEARVARTWFRSATRFLDRVRPAVTQGGGALSPSWHPSGNAIAYSAFGDRGTEIRVVDLSSNSTRRLSGATSGLNITPDWTPRGSGRCHGFP